MPVEVSVNPKRIQETPKIEIPRGELAKGMTSVTQSRNVGNRPMKQIGTGLDVVGSGPSVKKVLVSHLQQNKVPLTADGKVQSGVHDDETMVGQMAKAYKGARGELKGREKELVNVGFDVGVLDAKVAHREVDTVVGITSGPKTEELDKIGGQVLGQGDVAKQKELLKAALSEQLDSIAKAGHIADSERIARVRAYMIDGGKAPGFKAEIMGGSDVDLMVEAAQNGALNKEVTVGKVYELLSGDMNRLAYQERRARQRTIGDHGERHLNGNIRRSEDVFRAVEKISGEKTSAVDILQMRVIHRNHDLGYAVGASRHGFGGASEEHPEIGAQIFDQHGQISQVFGEQKTKEMAQIIRTHDKGTVDIKGDLLGTAVRISDNTCLFHDTKLPAIFTKPENMDALAKIQSIDTRFSEIGQLDRQIKDMEKSGVGDTTDLKARKKVLEAKRDPLIEVQKERIRENIRQSDLTQMEKDDYLIAANDISPGSGAYTLNRLSGEYNTIIASEDKTIEGGVRFKVILRESAMHDTVRQVYSGSLESTETQFNKANKPYKASGTVVFKKARSKDMSPQDMETAKILNDNIRANNALTGVSESLGQELAPSKIEGGKLSDEQMKHLTSVPEGKTASRIDDLIEKTATYADGEQGSFEKSLFQSAQKLNTALDSGNMMEAGKAVLELRKSEEAYYGGTVETT